MRRLVVATLVLGLTGCSVIFNGDDLRRDGGTVDTGVPVDAGTDAGVIDGGLDGGSPDAEPPDSGPTDAEPPDSGPDAGPSCVIGGGVGLRLARRGVWSSGEPIVGSFSATMLPGAGPRLAVALPALGLAVTPVGALAREDFTVLEPSGDCAELSPQHVAVAPDGATGVRLVLAQDSSDGPMMQGLDVDLRPATPSAVAGDCIQTPSREVTVRGAAALVAGVNDTVAAAFGQAQEIPPGGFSSCLAVGQRQCADGAASGMDLLYGTSLPGMVIGSNGPSVHYRSASRDSALASADLGSLGFPPTGRIAAASDGTSAMLVAPRSSQLQILQFTCADTRCSAPDEGTVSTTSVAAVLPESSAMLDLADLGDGRFLLAYAEGMAVVLRVIDSGGSASSAVGLPSLVFDAPIADLAVLHSTDGPVVLVQTNPTSGEIGSELHQLQYTMCME